MASISLFFSICLVICISAGNANTDFIKLQCNVQNVGQYGQQSLLMCVIHTTAEVSNAEIRVVTWRKEGVKSPLLVFHKGEITLRTGYKFAEPSWNSKNMNVSLLITNTDVRDDGVYTCSVITDSGNGSNKTNLQVTAKYNPPTITSIPHRIVEGADGTLICNTDGGYPEGQLRWFDGFNTDWTKSSELEASQTKDGLFQLSSKLMLKSGSIFTYTCVVYNATGGKVNEVKFDPQSITEKLKEIEGGKPSSKVVAPVVVIGSLIVGLLIVLLLFLRRRSRQARRPSTSPLMGDHQEVCTHDVEEGNFENMDTTCKTSQT